MESQGPRKKFAKPPVKLACLSCRGSRIRCDGKQPCVNCLDRGKECQYTQSKRGGPRIPQHGRRPRDKTRTSNVEILKQESPPLTIEDQYFQATTLSLVGAGLRPLDAVPDDDVVFPDTSLRTDEQFFDSSYLNQVPELLDIQFDCAFEDSGSSGWDSFNDASLKNSSDGIHSEMRIYETDANILDAYYVYIHAYSPLLPPPIQPPVDRPMSHGSATGDYMPTTPLPLALLAILTLIPLLNDPDPRSEKSTWDRRIRAHKFAQASFEALDNESELIDSIINPKDALSNGPACSHRAPFHRDLPLDLEANIALLLLSVYEYAQRGNIKKMLNRGGQSLRLALDAKLYSSKGEEDQFAEARRRVWWATYINACQGSIASNATVAVDLHDPKFTISYPTITSDTEAFSFYIRCEQSIVDATQYVLDLTEILDQGGDLSAMYMRTLEMEGRLESLSQVAEALFDKSPSNMPVDSTEAVVARSLRAIGRLKINSARIKVHRYSAFMNRPIFWKRHCDLECTTPISSPASGSNASYSNLSASCSCTSEPQRASDNSEASVSLSAVTPATPNLPFNTAYSANICRKSALQIAESFDMIPYPNPSGVVDPSAFLLLPNSSLPLRTMPTFTCCGMQSAYALLMLLYNVYAGRLESPNADIDLAVATYVDTLRHNLKLILVALENYSSAFEAMDGMREEVAIALDMLVV